MVLDASNEKAAAKLMRGHDAALSAVPHFLNLGLARAALEARCHFADLGGNNTVVRQELALSKKAESCGVAVAPDCGAFFWDGIHSGRRTGKAVGRGADALRLYVGWIAGAAHAAFPLSARIFRRGTDQRVCGTGAHSTQGEIDYH